MKIVIAPDSFKESLSSLAVAEAIKAGFERVFPDAQYCLVPMADGGEGMVEAIVDATDGSWQQTEVCAPLGNRVQAAWGMAGDGKTAIIEMAAASGLPLVAPHERNPLISSSYGTGELIQAALDKGVEKIILGIGGSATNDAGVGMLSALGAKFLDVKRQEIPRGGAALAEIAEIDLSGLDARLQAVEIEVACDVDNPLCGERGASAVFGPQKGANAAQVAQLDAALAHFAAQVERQLGKDIAHHAGAGAAGGMGAGLLLLPKVRLMSGVKIVREAVKLHEAVLGADLLITGEGRMDAQSVYGKTPIGVAEVAQALGVPCIAIVGSLREDYEAVYQHGIQAVFPIIRQLTELPILLKQGRENVISTAQNVARLWAVAKGNG